MKSIYHGDVSSKLLWTSMSDNGIYSEHRIPGIVVTKKDTVIIYCEARDANDMQGSRGRSGDWSRMDIYIQRSEDGGDTFEPPIYISRGRCSFDGNKDHITINNPIMIVGNDNTLHFLFCKDYSICGGGLWYTKSFDDGKTWNEPREITEYARKGIGYDFACFAFGPTHGICTERGVLMAAVWAVKAEEGREIHAHGPSNTHLFYSTDNGETWKITEKISKNGNETCLAELSDGRIMINSRMNGKLRGLNFCKGFDGDGEPAWEETSFNDELIDPDCCGGMTAVNIEGLPYGILAVNCDDLKFRRKVTVKCSFDDGKTFTKKLRVTENYGGYCDIACDSKGRIFVIWELTYGAAVGLTRFSFADEFCKDI